MWLRCWHKKKNAIHKKKGKRYVQKASTTKMISKVKELLYRKAPDLPTLTKLVISLREKLEVINTLNREISELANMVETNIVEKMKQVNLCKSKS